MNTISNNKLRLNLRLLVVFFALVAYGAQSLAFVGGMAMPKPAITDHAEKRCHGDQHNGSQATVNISQVSANENGDCCQDGCPMLGCHSTSAVLSNIYCPSFMSREAQHPSLAMVFVANVSSSLYRPPILH